MTASWQYSHNPSAIPRDAVRFLAGDTDSTKPLVYDDEIAWALAEAGNNVYRAAAIVCRAVAGKITAATSRGVGSKSVGDFSISFDSAGSAGAWTSKADDLDAQANRMNPGLPHAGGISRARRDVVDSDSDLYSPAFARGQFDRPDDSWRDRSSTGST